MGLTLNRDDEISKHWNILLGCTLGASVGAMGLNSYANGTLIAALHENLGWSRERLTAVQLAMAVVVALIAPFAGTYMDRRGAVPLITFSIVCEVILFAGLGLVPLSFGTYIILNLLLMMGGIGTMPPSFSRITTITFERRRGLALGLVVAGLGAMAIATPLVLSRVVAATTWRGAYLALSAWVAAAGCSSVWLIRRGERVRRSRVDAGAVGKPTAWHEETERARYPLRSPLFWLLLIAFVIPLLSGNGYLALMTSILRERGFSASGAGAMQAVMGVAMLLARIFSGSLMDRFSATIVCAVTFTLSAFGAIALWLQLPAFVPAAAFLLGITLGAELDIIAFLVARYFGVVHFGKIYGVYYGALVISGGGSAFFLTMIARIFGGFRTMFVASAVGMLAGAAIALLAGRLGETALRRDRLQHNLQLELQVHAPPTRVR
jgi:MFS family permease